MQVEDQTGPSFLQCQWEISKIGIPTIISCLFEQLPAFVNIVYAGKFADDAKLAGVGLGQSLLWSLTLYIIVGMNGALETLVSQAFGANQLKLCGVYLNRARVINTAISLPLMGVMFFTKPILSVFGQQPEVIEHAN